MIIFLHPPLKIILYYNIPYYNTMADFQRDLLVYGGIDSTKGNMFLKGNVRMLGAGSSLADLTVGNLSVTGNAVIPGISFASLTVAGNVTSGKNFIGNGALLTGVTSTLPSTGNIDISGNITGTYANVTTVNGSSGNIGNVQLQGGNVRASGQINAIGNVVGNFFIGNGTQLTGITTTLPPVVTADIRGNIIGTYANVQGVIALAGNIGNVAIDSENVRLSGQINALGNVVGNFFIGNGSQLTGLIPPVVTADIRGNIIGTYANVQGVIALAGNIGNVAIDSENVRLRGQVNALGNVVGNFFIGNGSQLTGLIPPVVTADVRGNIIGTYANVQGVIALAGNIGNVAIDSENVRLSGQINALGNVVGNFFIGNGSQLTGLIPPVVTADFRGNIIGTYANVQGVIALAGNIGNVAIDSENIRLSGQINALGNVVAPIFIGNGSQLTDLTPTKITAPGFRAYQSVSQFLPGGVSTLYQFDTLDTTFDNTYYNRTGAPVFVNGRSIPAYAFSPNVAGFYLISATTRTDMVNNGGEIVTIVYKNNAAYANGSDVNIPAGGSNFSSTVSTLMYLNGTSDYAQLYIFSLPASNSGAGVNSFAWFDGLLMNTGTVVK